jgi:hypothetical protein
MGCKRSQMDSTKTELDLCEKMEALTNQHSTEPLPTEPGTFSISSVDHDTCNWRRINRRQRWGSCHKRSHRRVNLNRR